MTLYRGNPRVAGLVALAGIALLIVIAFAIGSSFGLPGNWHPGLPPARDYTLRAAFADANGLSKGASVQVAGDPVGQVTDVGAAGRHAVVGMRIDHRYAPMHRGTIARIRYSTLLAQKYVELSPAAGSPSLADGATIPSDQTVTPVDFDQFLSTLDPETRRQAQVLVQQLGGGVEGRGETVNLLLDQLSGLAGESRAGLGTLDAHDADLSSITANLATTSARLAESRQQLGDLIANTASVAGTLSDNDRSLDDLLVHLAATSRDVDQTLDGNEGNLHDTVTQLDPLLSGLNSNLATTYPYLHGSQPELKAAFDALIPSIGSAIAQRDAGGNYLRQYIVLDTCYDQRSGVKANPATGAGCIANVSLGGPAPPSGSHAPPAPPPNTAPAPAAGAGRPTPRPTPCPSPLVALPPVTLPSPLPAVTCPTPPPCAPPSPAPPPRPSPTPSPSPSPCTSVLGGVTQGLPLPLPSAIGALLGLP
ncbi:MAG TPA: MCE family protein [Candidatus Dormibacteraeota bacterium]|jgi:phospholipid/cholesterol/gamma-HCH transport system substrate-binding protein